MPYTCWVPKCRTGYRSRKQNENDNENKVKLSLFKAPKDAEALRKWQNAIPRSDRSLTSKDWICELHFYKSCIERFHDKGKTVKRERPVLLPNALPSIFPNCPTYLTKKEAPTRNTRTRSTIITSTKSRRTCKPSVCTESVIADEAQSSLAGSGTLETESSTSDKVPSTLEGGSTLSSTEKKPTEESEVFSFEVLKNESFNRESWIMVDLKTVIRYLLWSQDEIQCRRYIEVDSDLSVKVVFGQKRTGFVNYEKIENRAKLEDLMKIFEEVNICDSAITNNFCKCRGFSKGQKYCGSCKARREQQPTLERVRRSNKNIKRRMHTLNLKIKSLKQRLMDTQRRCAQLEEETVLKKIEDLHLEENLKENIRNCIQRAKAASKKGIRYSRKWLYKCILLKIKSTKAYHHMMNHNIMPLPHPETIRRYLRKLKPSYGFQLGVFETLKAKATVTSNFEKEGCLLVDKMSLRETYNFNQNTFEVLGFTDLGEHTPENQKTKLGDHALVLMYQPYSGAWIQPIGCFLSRGAAPSKVLYEILLEAIIMLEYSGFRVNNITSDGAQPNRGMWTCFGITVENGTDVPTISCEHPCDSGRKLWFVSDFPLLIKNVRNWITETKRVFKTPDGTVDFQHWQSLLNAESKRFRLRTSYKLTERHLRPSNMEKMDVTLAYQFFDYSMADGMEHYKIEGCDATCKFIRRIRRLIHAMSSRSPKGALRKQPINSAERKDIEDFLVFLDNWEKVCPPDGKKKQKPGFLTLSTSTGLKVTLRSTLELLKYLTEERGFLYFMTARLNQDNIEKFFGMIRGADGDSDHPDSIKFLYLYKLMSSYYLLKPPKGSNVSNDETFTTFQNLMDKNEILGKGNPEKFTAKDIWRIAMDHGADNFSEDSVLPAATYDELLVEFEETERDVIENFTGYVVRKAKKVFTHCEDCIASLQGDRNSAGALLSRKDKFHVLNVPSTQLMALTLYLEKNITDEIGDDISHLKPDTFFKICRRLDQFVLHNIETNINPIGCKEEGHGDALVTKIAHFYLTARMHLIIREAKKLLKVRGKAKGLRKQSKLQKN